MTAGTVQLCFYSHSYISERRDSPFLALSVVAVLDVCFRLILFVIRGPDFLKLKVLLTNTNTIASHGYHHSKTVDGHLAVWAEIQCFFQNVF